MSSSLPPAGQPTTTLARGSRPTTLSVATIVAVGFAVCLAQVGVAVPATLNGTFQTVLHPTGASQLDWISDAILLPIAALELTFGVLGDLFGRKKLDAFDLRPEIVHGDVQRSGAAQGLRGSRAGAGGVQHVDSAEPSRGTVQGRGQRGAVGDVGGKGGRRDPFRREFPRELTESLLRTGDQRDIESVTAEDLPEGQAEACPGGHERDCGHGDLLG